jgi:D-glycero-D-manno-heptose 1,7-bisphosphate phosphatase
MARAVFLDRDGVLNRNVFYADTHAWESPRSPEAVELTPGIAAAVGSLKIAGYQLILVSNQPNAAKGKCSREALDQVHARVISLLSAEGVMLDAQFLCFHHPEHTGLCACRKPSPFFLLEAAATFGIDLEQSWMIGDRPTDVQCGRAAGTRTVWIDNGEGAAAPGPENAPDFIAPTVPEAIACLLEMLEAATRYRPLMIEQR